MSEINRRTFMARAAVGFTRACAAAASPGAWNTSLHTSGKSRPNILLAISDDQSWIHASAYGCPGLNCV